MTDTERLIKAIETIPATRTRARMNREELLSIAENNTRPWVPLTWLSIDTAPKDGTEILAYIPSDGNSLIYWEDSRWVYTCRHTPFDIEPTHWLPLPKPPDEN